MLSQRFEFPVGDAQQERIETLHHVDIFTVHTHHILLLYCHVR